MNAVISSEVARQITRGRTPLVPVEYEDAIKALDACITLDEARYWSAKADALAAWAKIHHSGEVVRKAKALKLHAFRRMGELAGELNPRKSTTSTGGRGSIPGSGPRNLLIKHGLSIGEADAARMLAKLTEKRFDRLLEHPMAPTTFRYLGRDDGPWRQIARAMMSLRSCMRRHTAAQTIDDLGKNERTTVTELLTDVMEWLDEFDSRLKKVPK